MNVTTTVVTVTTAGTPVRVTTDTSILASRFTVQPADANTGRIWIGTSGMNKSTGAAVVRTLAIPSSGVAGNVFSLDSGAGFNNIQASQFYIDAEVNGEKAIVNWFQT